MNPGRTSAVIEVSYPAAMDQTANDVPWRIRADGLDTWQVNRGANQQWLLGKQLSTGYVGGVSAATGLSVVQAILKYDQAEQYAKLTLNADLLAPVATAGYLPSVRARFNALKARGITGAIELMSGATFCTFIQDSPQRISVYADEVWSYQYWAGSRVVERGPLEHVPQVEQLSLVGGKWLMNDIDVDLPADFPNACRG
jgi:hypothetical protein